jgi:hypothetical protein
MAAAEQIEPVIHDETGQSRAEWLVLVLVFLAACALVVLKRPDAVTNPQFYVEDGSFWYAQANDLGPLRALAIPYRGYLVIAQRLGAALALLVPFAWAPLVCNLVGVAVQALPAMFVASRRIAASRPLWLRVAMGLLYVAMPATWAITANLTHTMWHLAPLAVMVVVADPSRARGWRLFDAAVLVVAGLSGPFALFLLPVAAINWWLRRERRDLGVAVAIAVMAAIQLASLLLAPPPPDGRIPIGLSAGWFVRILAQRVVYGALFGQTGTEAILGDPSNWLGTRAAVGIAAALGVAALGYAVWRGPRPLRLYILYAVLAFVAALAWPAPNKPALWWALLKHPGNGNRYFAAMVFALLVTFIWLAAQKHAVARVAGALGLAVALVVGIRLDLREPPLPDYNFAEAVTRYRAATDGERVSFVTPPGWEVVLTKHGAPEHVADGCAREVRVDAHRLGQHEIAWEGESGRATGGDPYAVYEVPDLGIVCGARIRYELTTEDGAAALLQVFWMKEGTNVFVGDVRNSTMYVPSRPAAQTSAFRINDRIDRLRIDPGGPGTRFRLLEVVLLYESE